MKLGIDDERATAAIATLLAGFMLPSYTVLLGLGYAIYYFATLNNNSQMAYARVATSKRRRRRR